MVLVAPNEAHGLAEVFELLDEIEHLRAVARDAGVIAEALGPEDRERPAIAEADDRGLAVEKRFFAKHREHVGDVLLAGLDALQARLPTGRRARIVALQGTGGRGAPEQIRRRGDEPS